jgi:DNA-binding XRE family transcriptional regulator
LIALSLARIRVRIVCLLSASFPDLEQIVRFLREAAGLTRNEMSDGTGVSVSTIRNLEKARHTASMWTWHQLLGHESMRNFSRIAAESGLAMPDVRNPHDPDPGSGSGTPGAGLGGTVGTGDGGESGGASGSGGTP